jgi:hypothetical protein
MVDSENVGNGEIQERNRTVVHLLCEIRRASRVEFLAINLVWKGRRKAESFHFLFNVQSRVEFRPRSCAQSRVEFLPETQIVAF